VIRDGGKGRRLEPGLTNDGGVGSLDYAAVSRDKDGVLIVFGGGTHAIVQRGRLTLDGRFGVSRVIDSTSRQAVGTSPLPSRESRGVTAEVRGELTLRLELHVSVGGSS
jgi:hypothetical protein